ncbi:lipase member I-like protein [Dinothrombium tinctorium]|uniref:Lipase member I-like protein n=1 Tax=Dinothrombium tinctorium TaxID=1965070 RepID=A0A443RLZ5_9ACAR|nr:lipase member I-like protein [Dinothrombium tinctorium]
MPELVRLVLLFSLWTLLGHANGECNGVVFENIGCVEQTCGCLVNYIDAPLSGCVKPKEVKTEFKFYRKANKNDPVIVNYRFENISQVPFDNQNPTVIIVHGLNQDTNPPNNMYQAAKDLYLEEDKNDVNVILVDWSDGAKAEISLPVLPIFDYLYYAQAVANIPVVSKQSAFLVKNLHEQKGLDVGNVRLIGHSLGSHVVANINRFLLQYLREYIDELFGITAKVGHSDFYVNDGTTQPNCPLLPPSSIICNHQRSVWLTDVDFSNYGSCQPVAYECESYSDFLEGLCADCDNAKCQLLGYDVQVYNRTTISRSPPEAIRHNLRIKTTGETPFCSNDR